MLPSVEDQLVACLRIAIGGALGAVLGWDRERKHRPAGMRTHIAVGMAAALIMGLADLMVRSYAGGEDSGMQMDPTRVLEAVVGGVAFLGAGTIIVHRDSERVRGLTTAAGLLVTAGLGVAAGIGAYVVAVAGAGAMLGVLLMADWLGHGADREPEA